MLFFSVKDAQFWAETLRKVEGCAVRMFKTRVRGRQAWEVHRA